MSDSRALFNKHNVKVEELKSPPEFNVLFNASDTLMVQKYLETNSGINRIRNHLYPTIEIGPFTLPDAIHIRRRINFDLPVDSVEIRRE